MEPVEWLILIALILSIIATVVSMLFRPKPVPPMPEDLSNFKVPTADAARPIPVIFGTVMLKGPNVVWYGDLTATPIYYSGGKK